MIYSNDPRYRCRGEYWCDGRPLCTIVAGTDVLKSRIHHSGDFHFDGCRVLIARRQAPTFALRHEVSAIECHAEQNRQANQSTNHGSGDDARRSRLRLRYDGGRGGRESRRSTCGSRGFHRRQWGGRHRWQHAGGHGGSGRRGHGRFIGWIPRGDGGRSHRGSGGRSVGR